MFLTTADLAIVFMRLTDITVNVINNQRFTDFHLALTLIQDMGASESLINQRICQHTARISAHGWILIDIAFKHSSVRLTS